MDNTGTTENKNTNVNKASNNATADANKEPGEETAEVDASLLRKLLNTRLVKVSQNIEIERKNPDSPLYSVKSFEELNLKAELLKGIYAMGFTRPSKIQETALPALINNPPQNLIAQSQSGTGKTAAFVLTMLSRVDTNLAYPQALCLAPTIELAGQIADVAEKMGQFIKNLTIGLAVKGRVVERNIPIRNQIIIGTPGTVLDWALKFYVFDLRKIRAFVLDEADVMIAQQGHQDFSVKIVRNLDKKCQMMLFSATYTNSVLEFATRIVKEPMIIRLRRQEESLDYIKQFYVVCKDNEAKYSVILDVYGGLTVGQAIIFCETKSNAHNLAVRLTKDSISCELLSGELDVQQRASVIERFRAGKSKLLVTTNVASRGIDIEDVSLVFNYDLPLDRHGNPDFETYLHRIGRTGRFGKVGIAINLVENSYLNIIEKIQTHFGKQIKKLDANDLEAIEKLNS